MKKNARFLLSLCLTGSLIFNTTAFYQPVVHAGETTANASCSTGTETMDLYQEGKYPSVSGDFKLVTASKGKMSVSSASASQIIYNGLLNTEESIDISSFKLTVAELKDLVQDIMNTSPELFYVSSGYSYSPDAEGYVAAMIPLYKVTGTTLEEQRTVYRTGLSAITSQIDASWSDLEKILFTHDYICQNFKYDTTYSIYDAYNFFREGTGVCQAYTLTFLAVMKELGIEASVASSNAMSHIWNVVKVNGRWYHLDITWDDPISDKFGLASHNNLLLSDTAIATCRGGSKDYHHDWSAGYTCSDTTYDTYFWENSHSPFQNLNGTWYYTYYDTTNTSGILATYDFDTKQTDSVTTLGKWYVNGSSGYYTGCYSGLDTYNGSLYYHTSSSIYAYNPLDRTSTTIYTPDKSAAIYGMRIDGSVLSYSVSTTPNDSGTIYTYALSSPAPVASTAPSEAPAVSTAPSKAPVVTTEPVTSAPASTEPVASPTVSYIPGDVDTDEQITLTDAQIVLKAALKIVTLTDMEMLAADVDENNVIELSDAQLILKYALKIINSFKKNTVLSASLNQTLYNGLINCASSIDVSSYNLTLSQLREAMQHIFDTCPDLFYVESGYAYTLNGNNIATVKPKYSSTGATLQQQRNYYQSCLSEIISQINPAWSDLEKILFAHDYLAQNFEYDTSYSIHDTYNFFKSGKGVCQAYTLTFIAIMNELGIESGVASSDSMSHIWNLVKLNGKWYHIDNTWDDPVNDKFGLAKHNNLLLSDTAIATSRNGSSQTHYNWTADYTCTDTTYDSYFWENSDSPFQYLNGKWYYTYYSTTDKTCVLATYNFNKKQSSPVTSFDKWYVSGNSFYTSCFSGLDVYDGMLYYHSGTTIYRYNPSTDISTTVLTPNKSGSIFGIRIEGTSLYYAVSDSPNNTGTIYQYKLETSGNTPVLDPSSAKPGDVDLNDNIDLADAQLTLKAALKIVTLEASVTALADVDSDNAVTLQDAQLILKYALKIITSF